MTGIVWVLHGQLPCFSTPSPSPQTGLPPVLSGRSGLGRGSFRDVRTAPVPAGTTSSPVLPRVLWAGLATLPPRPGPQPRPASPTASGEGRGIPESRRAAARRHKTGRRLSSFSHTFSSSLSHHTTPLQRINMGESHDQLRKSTVITRKTKQTVLLPMLLRMVHHKR